MSRTARISRSDWRKKTTNHRDQQGCGRGKGCGVCGDASPRSNTVRLVIAKEKMAEVANVA